MGEEANPTTLLLMAHICAALDSGPEWLQWVQAPDTLSAAGAAGFLSWGLMLPTSTSYPGGQLHEPGVCCASPVQTTWASLSKRIPTKNTESYLQMKSRT